MISIVLPVYKALPYLKETLISISTKTYYPFELIIIDDNSGVYMQEFLESISLDSTLAGCTIKFHFNQKQMWVNYNWNLGAKLATHKYVAFVNSDIRFSKDWDKHLVDSLQNSTIACPHELRNGILIKNDPLIEKTQPNMIKGACFMVKDVDIPNLFPIPPQLLHWCGDNWLAWKARKLNGVAWADCHIEHAIHQSGREVDPDLYAHLVLRDVLEYESLTRINMKNIKKEVYASLGISY